jgi:hypothetical protein
MDREISKPVFLFLAVVMAANELKMSGEPLPIAKNVTPYRILSRNPIQLIQYNNQTVH